MKPSDLEETLRDMTPEQLGFSVKSKFYLGSACFFRDDIHEAFAKLNEAELKEILRYANYWAEKEGLGKEYFSVLGYTPPFQHFTDEEVCFSMKSAAAA